MYTFKRMQATHDSCTTQQKCTKASKYKTADRMRAQNTACADLWQHMLVCSISLVSLCVVYASQSSSPGAVYVSIHSHADLRRLSRGGFMTKKLRFNLILYWRTSWIDDPQKWRKVQEQTGLVQLCKTCEEHLQGTGL